MIFGVLKKQTNKNPFFLALQDSLVSSCIFPVPSSESVISLGTCFLLPEYGIQNQDLVDMHLGCCCWDVVTSSHSWLPEQGNICMCTLIIYTYINIYIYMSLYICIFMFVCTHTDLHLYLYLAKHEFILMSPTLICYYMGHTSHPICLSITSRSTLFNKS